MESDSEATIEDTLEITQDARVSDFLAKHHRQLYSQKNDPKLLNDAILCTRRTVELSSSMNPLLRRYCFRVANYLLLRHRESNQPSDADVTHAMSYLEMGANSLIEIETPREKAQRLAVRAECHCRLYQSGRDEEYERALQAFDEVLSAWRTAGDADKLAQGLRDTGAVYAIPPDMVQGVDQGS